MARRAIKQRKAESEGMGGVLNQRFTGDGEIDPGVRANPLPENPEEKARQQGYRQFFGRKWRRYYRAGS